MKKILLSLLLLVSVYYSNAQTYAYTIGSNCIEFKTGLIVTTIPTPLIYVKLDTNRVTPKIYIYSASGDIVFPERGLPINGFTTLLDVYNDLKVYSCSALVVLDSNSWKLQGNNIGPTDFLGTNNGQPLVIKTSGTEKARITVSGRVGIGTNNPSSTLDINGDLRARGLTYVGWAMDTILGIDDSGFIYKTIVSSGGGDSFYLYKENYDSATFLPNTVNGLNSATIGVGNFASGDYSIAMGSRSDASGYISTAFGSGNIASGNYSTAFGVGSEAANDNATAFGNSTFATGHTSTAFGAYTRAVSFSETAFGISNTAYVPLDSLAFVASDRLVVVGNGDGVESDAFTILKNAKVGIGIDNFELTTNSSKLQVNGLIASTYQTINADIVLDSTNISTYNLIDNIGGAIIITLPNPSSMSFKYMSARITFKLITDNLINAVTILPYGAETIDKASILVFTSNYQSIDLVTDGTNWWIVSNNN